VRLKKKKILRALLEFNEEGVKGAVLKSQNASLIDIMYHAKMSETSDFDDGLNDDLDQERTFHSHLDQSFHSRPATFC